MVGDEYWYVYDLDDLEPYELSRHATHLVKTLLAFFSKDPFDLLTTVPEESDDPYAELEIPDAIVRRSISWKSTVDVLNHAIDLSQLAEDKLDSFLAGLTSQGKIGKFTTAGDAEFLELKNRLGVGFSITKDEKVAYGIRSDFIGLEVDRFFRLSKHAEEGKLLAGKEFLSLLEMAEIGSSGKFMFRDPLGGGSFTTAINCAWVEHRNFSADAIKGITGGYAGAFISDDFSWKRRAQPAAGLHIGAEHGTAE